MTTFKTLIVSRLPQFTAPSHFLNTLSSCKRTVSPYKIARLINIIMYGSRSIIPIMLRIMIIILQRWPIIWFRRAVPRWRTIWGYWRVIISWRAIRWTWNTIWRTRRSIRCARRSIRWAWRSIRWFRRSIRRIRRTVGRTRRTISWIRRTVSTTSWRSISDADIFISMWSTITCLIKFVI